MESGAEGFGKFAVARGTADEQPSDEPSQARPDGGDKKCSNGGLARAAEFRFARRAAVGGRWSESLNDGTQSVLEPSPGNEEKRGEKT